MLTLDVDQDELDLTGCGLDVAAVTTDLTFAGIPASAQAGDERNPHRLLRRVAVDDCRLVVLARSGTVSSQQQAVGSSGGLRHGVDFASQAITRYPKAGSPRSLICLTARHR
jgi:hypothetical protein